MSEETCEFAWMGEDGPIGCLAPVAIDLRWQYREPHPEWTNQGGLCTVHWMVACEQLKADPDVDQATIQVRRRA